MHSFLVARRRRALVTVAAVAGAAFAPWLGAFGQALPTIRLLVGYAPGGPVDSTARVLASRLAEVLGTTVVVENKPGAGGLLAAQELSRGQPDGSLLWFAASPTVTMSTHILTSVPVHTLRDITPVAPAVFYHNLLVVHASRPWQTLRELVAWSREHPEKFTFGSAGMGASNHLAAELLAMRSGIRWTHAPYKGSAPAMSDVIGGQIDGMFDITVQSKPQIDAGKVRALGMAALQRHPLLPEVPTVAESGLAGLEDFDVNGWMAFFGPKDMPQPLVQRLHAAVRQVLETPQTAARLQQMGHTLWPASARALQERAAQEHALWASVIRTIRF